MDIRLTQEQVGPPTPTLRGQNHSGPQARGVPPPAGAAGVAVTPLAGGFILRRVWQASKIIRYDNLCFSCIGLKPTATLLSQVTARH